MKKPSIILLIFLILFLGNSFGMSSLQVSFCCGFYPDIELEIYADKNLVLKKAIHTDYSWIYYNIKGGKVVDSLTITSYGIYYKQELSPKFFGKYAHLVEENVIDKWKVLEKKPPKNYSIQILIPTTTQNITIKYRDAKMTIPMSSDYKSLKIGYFPKYEYFELAALIPCLFEPENYISRGWLSVDIRGHCLNQKFYPNSKLKLGISGFTPKDIEYSIDKKWFEKYKKEDFFMVKLNIKEEIINTFSILYEGKVLKIKKEKAIHEVDKFNYEKHPYVRFKRKGEQFFLIKDKSGALYKIPLIDCYPLISLGGGVNFFYADYYSHYSVSDLCD